MVLYCISFFPLKAVLYFWIHQNDFVFKNAPSLNQRSSLDTYFLTILPIQSAAFNLNFKPTALIMGGCKTSNSRYISSKVFSCHEIFPAIVSNSLPRQQDIFFTYWTAAGYCLFRLQLSKQSITKMFHPLPDGCCKSSSHNYKVQFFYFSPTCPNMEVSVASF